MKFFSEKLNKLYDDAKVLEAEEKKYEKEMADKAKKEQELKETRSVRAKEIESLFKAADEARDKANRALEEFCNDYGSYHTTIRRRTNWFPSIFDFFL